jgi:hypothetical protein
VLSHLQNDLALLKGMLSLNDEQVGLLQHELLLQADHDPATTAPTTTSETSAGAGGRDGAGAGTAGGGLGAGVVDDQPRRIMVGEQVGLSPVYQQHSDASGGPHQLGNLGAVAQDDGSCKPD